jgi:cell division protein ZapA
MSNLIPVSIVIADRTYRLRVTTADEELLRSTVKLINEKIIEYKTQLAGKDMQDFVSMALLWFATSQSKGASGMLQEKNIEDELQALETLLDKTLN